MKLYTSKVIADWLGLTDRRVRQLRDEGIISEARPGLYDLKPTVAKYINYLGGSSRETLNEERTKLTAEKRKAQEIENELRRGMLHRTEDIETGLQTVFLNARSRFLSLPEKLAPLLANMGGDRNAICDELKRSLREILDDLSNYRVALAIGEDCKDEEDQDY